MEENNIIEPNQQIGEYSSEKVEQIGEYSPSTAITERDIESGKHTIEYLKQSFDVGFNKGIHWMAYLSKEVTPVPNFIKDPLYSKWIETAEQDVKEARQLRDNYAIKHKDDIRLGTKLAGGLIETVSNPIDVAANIALGIATGGSSLLINVGSQMGLDVGQLVLETYVYDGKLPTVSEVGTTAFLSGAFGTAGYILGGSGTTKAATAEVTPGATTKAIKPDIDIVPSQNKTHATIQDINQAIVPDNVPAELVTNVNKAITDYDTISVSRIAKEQELFTNYPNLRTNVDPYNLTDIPDRYNSLINTVTNSEPDGNLVARELTDSILTQSNSKPTILQRNVFEKEQIIKEISKRSNGIDRLDTGTGFIYNPKKTDIQNMYSMSSKTNKLVDKVLTDTEMNINEYIKSYFKAKESGFGTPVFNYDRVNATIASMHSKYTNYKINVANEYIQQMDINVNPKKLILDNNDDVGKLARAWITGDFSEYPSVKKFLDNARNDSIQLDEIKMKTKITDYGFDDVDVVNFRNNYPTIIDVDGDINYAARQEILDIINNKANPYRNIILDKSSSDNPFAFRNFLKENKEFIDKALYDSYDDWYSTASTLVEVPEGKFSFTGDFTPENVNNFNKAVNLMEKENAVLSTKINQTINKQLMLKDFNKAIANPEIFDIEIKPYYENGIFKQGKFATELDHFKAFTEDLGLTRDAAKYSGNRKTIGQLNEYFERGQLLNFFTSQDKYLKDGGTIISDILTKQSADIAHFATYGSISPYAMRNKLQFDFRKVGTKLRNKVLNEAELDISDKISKHALETWDNLYMSQYKPKSTAGEKINKVIKSAIATKELAFSGIAELTGQNMFIAMYRGLQYANSSLLAPLYSIAKMAKKSGGKDLVNSEYYLANALKVNDLSAASFKPVTKADYFKSYSDFSMIIQRFSEKQLAKWGDIISTSILHKLPDKWKKVDGHLKEIFLVNGIDEANYDTVRKLFVKHIDDNVLTVDPSKLYEQSIFSKNVVFENMGNIYTQLSNNIGNMKANTPYRGKVIRWATDYTDMFKSFSKAMNLDTIHRITYYKDADGLSRCRFTQPIQYAKQLSVRDISNPIIGSSLLLAGGLGYTLTNGMIKSKHDLRTRYEIQNRIVNKLIEGDYTPKELLDLSGQNPAEMFEASGALQSYVRDFVKIYDTFTDEEKAVTGENAEEALELLLQTFFRNTLGRTVEYNAEAIYSVMKGTNEEPLDKIIRLNKYDIAIINMNVRTGRYKAAMKLQEKQDLRYSKSLSDYLENKLDSYNNLPKEVKQAFDIATEGMTETEKWEAQSEFPIIWSNPTLTSVESKIYETKNNIKVNMPAPQTRINELSDKHKRLYRTILQYNSLEPSEEELAKFIDNFVNNSETPKEKLKELYGIDKDEFIIYYNLVNRK